MKYRPHGHAPALSTLLKSKCNAVATRNNLFLHSQIFAVILQQCAQPVVTLLTERKKPTDCCVCAGVLEVCFVNISEFL
jgi:hypothetical protein